MGRNYMQSMNLEEGGMNADVLNRLLGAMGGGMSSMNLVGGGMQNMNNMGVQNMNRRRGYRWTRSGRRRSSGRLWERNG
jgi:hypothetical protein